MLAEFCDGDGTYGVDLVEGVCTRSVEESEPSWLAGWWADGLRSG